MTTLEADQNLNGWAPFNLDECYPTSLLAPHWLYNSETQNMSIVRRHPGGRAIHMLDRKDRPVVPDDGFDWIKPVGLNAGALPHQKIWKNPLPVVVMLVPVSAGLLLVRRAAHDTHGKIALPGGFQEIGETWQEAGCREVFEETGVAISPSRVRIFDVETVESGKVNLIYGIYDGIADHGAFSPQEGEILEVLTTKSPVETAFESHSRMISRYFA